MRGCSSSWSRHAGGAWPFGASPKVLWQGRRRDPGPEGTAKGRLYAYISLLHAWSVLHLSSAPTRGRYRVIEDSPWRTTSSGPLPPSPRPRRSPWASVGPAECHAPPAPRARLRAGADRDPRESRYAVTADWDTLPRATRYAVKMSSAGTRLATGTVTATDVDRRDDPARGDLGVGDRDPLRRATQGQDSHGLRRSSRTSPHPRRRTRSLRDAVDPTSGAVTIHRDALSDDLTPAGRDHADHRLGPRPGPGAVAQRPVDLSHDYGNAEHVYHPVITVQDAAHNTATYELAVAVRDTRPPRAPTPPARRRPSLDGPRSASPSSTSPTTSAPPGHPAHRGLGRRHRADLVPATAARLRRSRQLPTPRPAPRRSRQRHHLAHHLHRRGHCRHHRAADNPASAHEAPDPRRAPGAPCGDGSTTARASAPSPPPSRSPSSATATGTATAPRPRTWVKAASKRAALRKATGTAQPTPTHRWALPVTGLRTGTLIIKYRGADHLANRTPWRIRQAAPHTLRTCATTEARGLQARGQAQIGPDLREAP